MMEDQLVGRSVPIRAGVSLALAMALVGIFASAPPPGLAQQGLSITTPYPAVSIRPGDTVRFDLTVSAGEPTRASLRVDGLPDGWTASLSGGGNEIEGVFVDDDAPATVNLTIGLADDAAAGTETITVVAASDRTTVRLPLDVTVSEDTGGSVTLTSDFPTLQGSVDTDFSFNLTLDNDTPSEHTFALQASGPAGWTVSIQPSGQARAASVTVGSRATQSLQVTATPSAQASPDTYPIHVEVVAGDERATADLSVEITGRSKMSLTTPDQRLNTTANAGQPRDFAVVVVNEGTTPLTGLTLSGIGPTEWDITFEPATLAEVAPRETATVTAHITPSANAVAGDYQVTLRAQNDAVNETLAVRVTVETAPIWGIVGIGLVLLTLAGMAWIFRRYGRR